MFYEGNAATCSNCFLHSQAVYYPNSDQHGTEIGACGFGRYGATINNGYVSAASNLYRGGIGCGACYQVRCTNGNFCSDKGVNVVITDQGSGPGDFILSRKAFGRMGESKSDAKSLLALGVVDIEYKRIPCSYPNKNIIIKIDENSDYPYYLAFMILYQQGTKDITAVKLCEGVPQNKHIQNWDDICTLFSSDRATDEGAEQFEEYAAAMNLENKAVSTAKTGSGESNKRQKRVGRA
ncbi:hypothetical protein AgCh_016846 [Apium graveolens]